MSQTIRKYQNWILPLLIVGISALLMGVCFDFYYDLNDDTMMRDIMSGIYSGTPDGHNMQTLYPLGALIALCYRISGSFPWYGVFLLLCQFGCFFAVSVRLCVLADAVGGGAEARWRNVKKLLCLLIAVVFQWGIWLPHMINVQYTITCGMLVGTAVFLFLTIPRFMVQNAWKTESETLSVRVFMIKSLPPLLLFLLAFQLRSEMALLVLPFLGIAGAFCWWEERPVFTGKNLKKYGGLFLLLLACMGLSLGVDALAYGGEWRTFRQFFNDRTTIYDFYPEVVTDDSFDTDLDELGAAFGARILLENYNFGLDKEIDEQMFSDIAVYAKDRVGGARDRGAIFRESLFRYRYRSFHLDDAPNNLLVILGYAINIIANVILFHKGVRESHAKTLSESIEQEKVRFGERESGSQRRNLLSAGVWLFLIFLVRSGLWMFILMRGRDPERITHSLYLVEFCLLAGLFLRNQRRDGAPFAESTTKTAPAALRYFPCGAAAILFLLSTASLIKNIPVLQADQTRRKETNRDWEAIDAYCRAHPDTFYFEDVYSTVAFSGKLLECRDNAPANYDIAGGWMCKSPLYRKKLALFGIEEAADALAEGKADFIMSDEEAEQRGTTWLMLPYAEKGLDVYVEEYGRIGENYGVYQVIPIAESGQLLRETKWEW